MRKRKTSRCVTLRYVSPFIDIAEKKKKEKKKRTAKKRKRKKQQTQRKKRKEKKYMEKTNRFNEPIY